MTKSITINKLLFILLELNAALDTGKYDSITQHEVGKAAESGDITSWIRKRIPDAKFAGNVSDDDGQVYNGHIDSVWNAYGTGERKLGVHNRGLCLLIAWTATLIQRVVIDKKLSLESM